METLKVCILGDPVALQRHRDGTNKKTGERFKYDPSSDAKKNFLWKALYSKRPPKPYSKAIKVDMYFFMARPKNHFRTGKFAGQLKANAPKWHTAKPDRDNLMKFVKDALNKIYWTDDSIICDGRCTKSYPADNVPRTIIHVTELE